jgi:hypothetical protein
MIRPDQPNGSGAEDDPPSRRRSFLEAAAPTVDRPQTSLDLLTLLAHCGCPSHPNINGARSSMKVHSAGIHLTTSSDVDIDAITQRYRYTRVADAASRRRWRTVPETRHRCCSSAIKEVVFIFAFSSRHCPQNLSFRDEHVRALRQKALERRSRLRFHE